VAGCALFVCIGFIMASRCNTLAGMYISYGGFVGFGVGMGYNAVISTILRWFPDRQGLISGLLMMGFGCGALLLGTVGAKLLAEFGWRTTFMLLGIFYAGVILFFSFFINPPGNVSFPDPAGGAKRVRESGGDVPTAQMIRRGSFWFFFIWAVALSAAGLTFVAHSTPMALSMGASAATAAFMPGLISVCNGSGRVIGGLSFDILGRKKLMPMISVGFIAAGALLFLGQRSGSLAALFGAFIVAGFFFGCVLPTNAAVIGSFFGLKHYSMNFSILNTNLIFSSLGPLLAGMMHTSTGSYSAMPFLALGFAVLSLALCFLIRKP
jgi:OFA family oxalate/formate antiporter-like MFS transporter